MQQSLRTDDSKHAGETPVTENRRSTVSRPRFGPDLQAQIGDQLRAMHHDVLNEKVPDRFLALLSELAKKDATGT